MNKIVALAFAFAVAVPLAHGAGVSMREIDYRAKQLYVFQMNDEGGQSLQTQSPYFPALDKIDRKCRLQGKGYFEANPQTNLDVAAKLAAQMLQKCVVDQIAADQSLLDKKHGVTLVNYGVFDKKTQENVGPPGS